ncbi:NACHT domain-containing protein [Gloeobacter morelensis]|uniref:NACHT domain-containing protein n=1 Tax=Gloeobacter morelensis MG652769 TaxID=2781736 RepID=A0ABY3PSM0_9CYAN|nr:NACHT domain-containing protein [Gloeobacter morelensis]UFP96737.1 NACHT domain-containing protein [Gloeobacter morelensis MG652769]
MTVDEVLAFLDVVLQPERLSDVQSLVFRHAWEGLTYTEIATATGYDDDYVRDVGSRLWQRLSKACGERVSKTNVHSALRRCQQRFARVETPPISRPDAPPPAPGVLPARSAPVEVRGPDRVRADWGEAMDVSLFYGRRRELDRLHEWIELSGCRLVALLGRGGMGKSALALRFAEALAGAAPTADGFRFLFWRSLRNAPPLSLLLGELLDFLGGPPRAGTGDSLDLDISRLLGLLRQHRCLVILDNAESLLEGGARPGVYRPGLEGYGELFRRIGESHHRSCLLMTSREKPEEVALLEGDTLPVRTLQLQGLSGEEGVHILKDKGLFGAAADFVRLSTTYHGNPLALKLVATSIRDIFARDIALFLAEGTWIFNGLHQLLTQQFERLSPLEKQVMYWLALYRDGGTVSRLQEDMVPQVLRQRILEALEFLRRRFLIEPVIDPDSKRAVGISGFTQQPVIMEYVTELLVENACAELLAGVNEDHFLLDAFKTYPLIQATARDDVREAQTELILKPVARSLSQRFSTPAAVEHYFRKLRDWLRGNASHASGYAGGSMVNLMRCLGVELSGWDFSGLNLRQAYLRDIELQGCDLRQCDLSQAAFSHALGAILAVAAHEDFVVGADSCGSLHLWHLASGRHLLTLSEHQSWVFGVAISPDGQTMASASLDQTVRLWDVRSGNCLRTLRGHGDGVWSVAFSPDGTLLASGSSDHSIRLWGQEGECLSILEGHTGWVHSVTFSPDGRLLASGGQDRAIRLWDVSSRCCLLTLPPEAQPLWVLKFTPDGKTLISSSVGGTVTFWDISSGRCVQTLAAHDQGVFALAVSPDGCLLASGSGDQTIKLWEIRSGQCLKILRGHTARIWSLAFSGQSVQTEAARSGIESTLMSGGDDHTVKIWNTATGRCFHTIRGYSSAFLSVAFSPNGEQLASGSEDRTLRLWDLRTGTCLQALKGHRSWVNAVAYSLDGRWIATGGDDYTVRLWEARTGQCLAVLKGHTHPVRSVVFSDDSTLLLTGSADHTVRLWELAAVGENFTRVRTIEAHSDWVFCIACRPGTALFATSSSDQTIKLWDLRTGKCLKTFEGHPGIVWSIAFLPNSPFLVSGGEDRTLRIWNVDTGECLHVLPSAGPIWSLCPSQDGRTLASGSSDHTITLWDLTARKALRTQQGHNNSLWCVKLSPSGELLASASQDETIRLWNVSDGNCLRILRPSRLYEQISIHGARGLTAAQRVSLHALGAVDSPPHRDS